MGCFEGCLLFHTAHQVYMIQDDTGFLQLWKVILAAIICNCILHFKYRQLTSGINQSRCVRMCACMCLVCQLLAGLMLDCVAGKVEPGLFCQTIGHFFNSEFPNVPVHWLH